MTFQKSTSATYICTDDLGFNAGFWNEPGYAQKVTFWHKNNSTALQPAQWPHSCERPPAGPGFLCCCLTLGQSFQFGSLFLHGRDTKLLPCGDTPFCYLVYLKITYSDWPVRMNAIKSYTNKSSLKFIKLFILFETGVNSKSPSEASTV